jgi:hypothetical protein
VSDLLVCDGVCLNSIVYILAHREFAIVCAGCPGAEPFRLKSPAATDIVDEISRVRAAIAAARQSRMMRCKVPCRCVRGFCCVRKFYWFPAFGSREETRLHLLAVRQGMSVRNLTETITEIRVFQAKALVDCGVPRHIATKYISSQNLTADKVLSFAEKRHELLVCNEAFASAGLFYELRLSAHICCHCQAAKMFFKTYLLEIDLEKFPFEPRRTGKVSVKIRDPIGAALAILHNPDIAGTSFASTTD